MTRPDLSTRTAPPDLSARTDGHALSAPTNRHDLSLQTAPPTPAASTSRRIRLSVRTACIVLALGTCPFDPSPASAAPAPAAAAPAPTLPRGVRKRLALWQQAANTGLTARYTLTRTSSLLWEPLVVHGALVYTAPGRLELRDDERTGATTTLSTAGFTLTLNDPSLPPAPAPQATPAALWLRARLLALLAAQSQDALLQDARAIVPRGPGQLLELSPPRSHAAHAEIDRLRVRLDPDTGAILELELTLIDGDRVRLELTDHKPA